MLICQDSVKVFATGSPEFLCSIGQQLAWLGSVCTLPEQGLCYCDTVWNDTPAVDGAGVRFEITHRLSPFDKDEEKPCWHALFGKSVVATGFPIPERTYDDKGLQIPVEVMAALAGVSLAVNVGSPLDGFVLKGDKLAFIPVERRDNHVQWHLIERGGETVEYAHLDQANIRPLGPDRLDEAAINSTVAFLGWTERVYNYAGTL